MSFEEDFLHLGNRTVWGEEVPFGLHARDRRQHVYVCGKSGTGKTTFLRNCALQDIEAGRGVAVLDPHGDLAESLIEQIPRWRTDHVVYFNPADMDFPVGLNLIEHGPPEERHLVASELVSIVRAIWPEFMGPRMEYFLYSAAAALADCQNVSLLAIPRLFVDERYRRWVVKQVKDPIVRSFWLTEFASYDKRFLAEAVSPIQNKIGQLLMTPHVRNIVGQVRSTINARFMMDNQRILIANLSKGRLGEDKARLLGAVLISKFQLAALSRADLPEEERRDFFLYVDEAHNFVTDSFMCILSEARKYRLCLTLAHQYLDQLSPRLLSSIMGNVGSLVLFRVGNQDAERFGRTVGDEHRMELQTLENHHCFASLLEHGRPVQPFIGRALSPKSGRKGRSENIRDRSRRRFASPREKVEDRIRRWTLG